jgi:hypothetical protein
VLLEMGASSVSVVKAAGAATCIQTGPCPTGTVCASCVATGCTGRCRKGKGGSPNLVSH